MRQKPSKILFVISAAIGVFFVLGLVVSPAFSAEVLFVSHHAQHALAIMAIGAAIFFESWRRISARRQLENFVLRIREPSK